MRKRRPWDSGDDDPLGGLVNLFDLWIVLAVCFLLASLTAAHLRESRQSPSPDSFEKLPHYRVSNDSLSGKGNRLGVAYRLESGEVVYVPDASAKSTKE